MTSYCFICDILINLLHKMSQNSSANRKNHHANNSAEKFANMDNLLILEKALEQSGQDWIENLNIIEQLLVRVTDRLSQENPSLRSKFIIRRLPTYLAPFTNKNEYAIMIEDMQFTITPPAKPSGSQDRPGTVNFGQIEIFYKPRSETEKSTHEIHASNPNEELPPTTKHEKFNLSKEMLNENQAYCSHEVFKRFTSAFVDAYQSECDIAASSGESETSYLGDVQLVGPHLLLDLLETTEVSKIFTLNQSPLPLPKNIKNKCTVNVNYLKSMLTINYEDTEVIVRPCLFYNKCFPKVNANILERLPLHHQTYLQIGESLRKGVLFFPTSFETLWTLQFWTSESHILSLYHPSSIVSRVFKLYAVFCINPLHFWETINSTFLVDNMDDGSIQSLMENSKGNLLNTQYLVSSFLFELEDFCQVEDWAPRNFATRFMHLLKTAVDSFEKGFHAHYFTKINVLRGIWKNADTFEKDEKSVLRELDDVTESQENLEDYGEKAFMAMNDLEDDFGFQFDDLATIDDDEDIVHRPTSETIYKNLNPRNSRESSMPCGSTNQQHNTERPTTISRMFGSNLVKKLHSKLSRRHSNATSPPPPRSKNRQSITDIASGFEESVAQMRRPDSLRLRFKFQTESDLTETTFSHDLQKQSSSSSSSPVVVAVHPQCSTTAPYSASVFHNEGFQNHVETIYSTLLLNLTQLSPFDSRSDQITISDLDKVKRALESQEELVSIWGKACNEFPKPKCICPHIFNPRQIQYLSLIIQTVSKCSPNMIQIVKTSKIPAWEISGDILRTVLHQMRMEVVESESLKEKQRPKGPNLRDKNNKSDSGGDVIKPRKKRSATLSRFSLKRRQNSSPCHHDFMRGQEHHSETDAQFSLEEPEIAATHRLLEWLWNLRCSEIGRLSLTAYHYIEQLYHTSLVNSHFLEQFSDDKVFSTMALKSAMAVTRIMGDLSLPVNFPLYAASLKGWLWAEMILSLASWNNDKGYVMKTTIPLETLHHAAVVDDDDKTEILERVLVTENANLTTLKKKNICSEGESEPDLEAATLAYHSEMATPIGWNDFEDPRRPGPLAVAILIFSSTMYYKKWEMSPGNIVQSMQHVGQMLSPPHRKTALNEVRKLNKSLSIRIYNFDDNVMSKTFRRLNSLRATRSRMMRRENAARRYLSCRDIGCENETAGNAIVTLVNGNEFECTRF
ncbi:uncharacterized protein LOC118434862 isoform X3 [Folsomia candida]|uniref:uncharacterized protein LOC118434862 isoform X3 n=1 Tax=Folsomia candida TaxID=158441 RepID=UPI00160552C5|nr:uncharacterized protein LOC118434862 isoform X3 [Folsomia candida]